MATENSAYLVSEGEPDHEEVQIDITDPRSVEPSTNGNAAAVRLEENETPEKRDPSPEPQVVQSVFFKDGRRHIDLVLAHQENPEKEKAVLEKEAEYREKFEKNLLKLGVKLEKAPKEESQSSNTAFVKLHVPWKVQLKYAERMRLKLRLREDKFEEKEEEVLENNPQDVILDDKIKWCCTAKQFKKVLYLGGWCYMNDEKIQEVKNNEGGPKYYTAEFQRKLIDCFDTSNQQKFINDTLRTRIAYRIMNEAIYGSYKLNVGINQLISSGAYVAVYPLHDGTHSAGEDKAFADMNVRQRLHKVWASWRKWYKFQPLHLIRRYLGDKFGIYFAWLGFYTKMLWYASFLGLITMIYSAASMNTRATVQEVCDPAHPTYAGELDMCPNGGTDYWKLKKTCTNTQLTYFFDNEATFAYAIFMALWATMFMEFWKRRQFELQYEWDLVQYDEEADEVRPEFAEAAPKKKFNPVTMKIEPYLPKKKRFTRFFVSYTSFLFWILIVFAALIAVIVCRSSIGLVKGAANDALGPSATTFPAQIFTTIMGTLIAFFIIQILNLIYGKIAVWLTAVELPRTHQEFEESLIFKIFNFQFVNYFGYLFYVAFFKDWLGGRPGFETYIGTYRFEQCNAAGCMYELSIQLMATLFGKIIWNDCKEMLIPWIMNKWRQNKSLDASEEDQNAYTRWEQDFDLAPVGRRSLTPEYTEMVIQFGFVTMFACSFPIAPMMVLINNILEIRVDARKFIIDSRRGLARTGVSLGIWFGILEFIGTISVITNAFTLAFTSEMIPKLVYWYRVYAFEGYTDFSLSTFAVADYDDKHRPANNPNNLLECRYRGFYQPPTATNKYDYSANYWEILVARLALIIALEHGIFFLKKLLDLWIPDRSKELRTKIKREHFIVKKMMEEAEEELDSDEEPTDKTD